MLGGGATTSEGAGAGVLLRVGEGSAAGGSGVTVEPDMPSGPCI